MRAINIVEARPKIPNPLVRLVREFEGYSLLVRNDDPDLARLATYSGF